MFIFRLFLFILNIFKNLGGYIFRNFFILEKVFLNVGNNISINVVVFVIIVDYKIKFLKFFLNLVKMSLFMIYFFFYKSV